MKKVTWKRINNFRISGSTAKVNYEILITDLNVQAKTLWQRTSCLKDSNLRFHYRKNSKKSRKIFKKYIKKKDINFNGYFKAPGDNQDRHRDDFTAGYLSRPVLLVE